MDKKENLNIRIKLLASNNVILAECDNYESEIFTPQIVNGRITFLNIIPNRRCCQISHTNTMRFSKKFFQERTNSSREHKEKISQKPERCSTSDGYATIAPLANSTPSEFKQPYGYRSQISNLSSRISGQDSTLPTPEPVRRAIPARPMINLPKGIKVSRIYHNPIEGTPKKYGRVVTPAKSNRNGHISANVSVLNASFKLPCSPIPTKRCHKGKSGRTNLIHSTPNDCIERWQKVLTPVRTYTRKSKQPVMINRLKSVEKLKRSKTYFNPVVPTYLLNPTQGLDVSHQIEIKKCKLIIDKKISISPRTYKKQQKQPVDVYKMQPYPHSLSFHKPRPYLEAMKMSAFDLLINSNRCSSISTKLIELFRKGCVNKASSTYSKYKVFSMVPPIQEDEQVLELSRISLQTSHPK